MDLLNKLMDKAGGGDPAARLASQFGLDSGAAGTVLSQVLPSPGWVPVNQCMMPGTPAVGGPRATPLPLTLYVHLPWCVRKCPYCDFNSHEVRGPVPMDRYVDGLLADLRQAAVALDGRVFESVFIGGGTPSLFPPDAIARLLETLHHGGHLRTDVEITLEANPGTVDESRLRGYRAAGVNRLSLGVQSFDDACLAAIGRIHGGDDARRSAGLAAEIFDNVNLDLMYGLPGQTPAGAAADVDEAASFGAAHLSCYQLTLEPNTVFAKFPPQLPEEDTQDAIETEVCGHATAAGYHRYEVSAYSRPGGECRHNRHYWEFADYLGIGAGAHSKLTMGGITQRETRTRTPDGYLQRVQAGTHVAERRPVARGELVVEFMMNALRLTGGVPAVLLRERVGEPLGAVWQTLDRLVARGWLRLDAGCITPTNRGQRYLNRLLAEFLSVQPLDNQHKAS
jgi:putative oxygen-independent coproporphyrinogen III oxidase